MTASADVRGLIDRYGSGDSGETPMNRSLDAVEFFYDLYHTENKVAIRTCHEVTLHEAHRRGDATAALSVLPREWTLESGAQDKDE